MIDLYTWPTPNGHKVHIMLEEAGLEYRVHPVNIGEGQQFKPAFLTISPNNRVPVIVDNDGPGGKPYPVFESGAILIYLAEKAGKLLSADLAERHLAIQWLMFQMASIGPIFGQSIHFSVHAPEKAPYAIERFRRETHRLFRVLEKRLGEVEYLAGNYSIADIATFPWARNWERRGIRIEEHPNLKRWLDAIGSREAVQRGVEILEKNQRHGPLSKAEQDILFGETQYKQR
jgi:GSH-dependent disulfide-bond oxidoreductase